MTITTIDAHNVGSFSRRALATRLVRIAKEQDEKLATASALETINLIVAYALEGYADIFNQHSLLEEPVEPDDAGISQAFAEGESAAYREAADALCRGAQFFRGAR